MNPPNLAPKLEVSVLIARQIPFGVLTEPFPFRYFDVISTAVPVPLAVNEAPPTFTRLLVLVTLIADDVTAEFPDAITERGLKHLKMLINSIKKGYKPYVLFLTQIQGINNFRIAKEIDPKYFEGYIEARKAGVKFLAYRCTLNSKQIKIEKKIKIIDDK